MRKIKLTNKQIEEIKHLYRPSKGGNVAGAQYHKKIEGSMAWLGERFNVSLAVIHRIIHGIRKPNLTIKERFMKYVHKTDNGCWLWIGCTDIDGYGDFSFSSKEKSVRAHRASWRLFKGKIPKDKWVLHKCDTPACVNPEHLFLGDHKKNIKDKIKKGRCKRTISKLTEEQVREIRAAYIPRKGGRPKGHKQFTGKCEGSPYFLAKKYGVSKATIKHIIRNQTWKNI